MFFLIIPMALFYINSVCSQQLENHFASSGCSERFKMLFEKDLKGEAVPGERFSLACYFNTYPVLQERMRLYMASNDRALARALKRDIMTVYDTFVSNFKCQQGIVEKNDDKVAKKSIKRRQNTKSHAELSQCAEKSEQSPAKRSRDNSNSRLHQLASVAAMQKPLSEEFLGRDFLSSLSYGTALGDPALVQNLLGSHQNFSLPHLDAITVIKEPGSNV